MIVIIKPLLSLEGEWEIKLEAKVGFSRLVKPSKINAFCIFASNT